SGCAREQDPVGGYPRGLGLVRRVNVHDAALKHGIEPKDAVQAATWAIWVDELDEDSPARELRLGFD
ncbi:MAG: hypothetical protein ABIR57_06765, partial [Aeromicrobium sp.]